MSRISPLLFRGYIRNVIWFDLVRHHIIWSVSTTSCWRKSWLYILLLLDAKCRLTLGSFFLPHVKVPMVILVSPGICKPCTSVYPFVIAHARDVYCTSYWTGDLSSVIFTIVGFIWPPVQYEDTPSLSPNHLLLGYVVGEGILLMIPQSSLN